MKIYPIITENWKMDGGVAFGVVPQTIWKKLIEPDENNLVKITTRCLLVVEGERKILFDVGMGRKQSEKYYGFRHIFGDHSIEKSLAEYGYTVDDITDVVFTHLHDDHVGGAVAFDDNGNPELVFKNAMHYCSSAQWHWANNPNKREIGSFFKINFEPIKKAGKMKFIESEGIFSENISFRIMNGHTQGQIIPVINSNDKTFVFAADFIPSAANIPLPFIPSVDIQPLETLKEKEHFLKEAVDNNYYLIFQHDYYTECCDLEETEKGIRMKNALSLNEILN